VCNFIVMQGAFRPGEILRSPSGKCKFTGRHHEQTYWRHQPHVPGLDYWCDLCGKGPLPTIRSCGEMIGESGGDEEECGLDACDECMSAFAGAVAV